jgi:hypothetical protein
MNLPILTAELPQNQKVMLSFVLIQLHGIFSSTKPKSHVIFRINTTSRYFFICRGCTHYGLRRHTALYFSYGQIFGAIARLAKDKYPDLDLAG